MLFRLKYGSPNVNISLIYLLIFFNTKTRYLLLDIKFSLKSLRRKYHNLLIQYESRYSNINVINQPMKKQCKLYKWTPKKKKKSFPK